MSENGLSEVANITTAYHIKNVGTLISPTFIRFVAEGLGISDSISEENVRFLSRLLTCMLCEVILEAKKYAMMSNRTRMTCTDIDNVLIAFGMPSVLLTNYLYNARNIIKVPTQGRVNYDLYYFNNVEVETDEYLTSLKNKLKGPFSDIGIKAHWLAINGVQPCIAENPFVSMNKTNGGDDNDTHKVENLPWYFHLQLYYRELTEASIGTLEDRRKDALTLLQRDPSVRHLIVPLCSFIFQGIRVNIASKNLAILIYIMRMVCSLIQNTAIPSNILQNHFSLLIPSILSCILSVELCAKQFEENHWALRIYSSKLIYSLCVNFDSTTSYLRFNVIEVLKMAITSSIKSITFDHAQNLLLNEGKVVHLSNFPYTSHFGAFYTFSLFPSEVSRANLLPMATQLSEMYSQIYQLCDKANQEPLKKGIARTESIILQIFSTIIEKDSITDPDTIIMMIGEHFYDSLIQRKSTSQQ